MELKKLKMDKNKLFIGITGSNGFIGSHLSKALMNSDKYNLIIFDRQHNDLMLEESLKSFVSGCDIIFHIAGANRDTNANLIGINVLGTLNLLEAIKRYGKKEVKFIYVSSIQVYNPSCSNTVHQEEDQLSIPDTIFGISKITAEKLICIYDFDSIIFRISNTYGPQSRPFYNSVIATFCYQIANNKTIQILGDIEQKRDFIFISDVVAGLIEAIDYMGRQKEVFNMGSGKLTSLSQIIRIIEKIAGKDIKVEYLPNRKENDGWVVTTQQNIHSKLNWGPNVDLENGLKQTYSYFSNSL